MNLTTIKDGFAVFKAGEEVADPAKWKARQITANQIVFLLAAIVALAKSLGFDLHLDSDTIAMLAGGILGAVNWAFTLATSTKVGIGPKGGTVREVAPAPANPAITETPADAPHLSGEQLDPHDITPG